KQYVELIHVPPITKTNKGLVTEIENKVDEILSTKVIDPEADTTDLENQIDKLVYTLYDLTPEEIAIVEGNV
ncbi:class I SAM-dependent DNA methyltransferase, partial [Candidatus Poribacteria bacterium]|nr:class I SAM-dependent DNA methyltransferase [Candidatus Poribacteria bacterium]